MPNNLYSVELIDVSGDDIEIAESAWISTSKKLTPEKLKRVTPFVNELASEKHTVPFEHNRISFIVESDIATHIQFLKHRIGVSISAQSARWQENKTDKYYTPNDWPQQCIDSYQSDVEYAIDKYHKLLKELEDSGVSRKRAKESARFLLPYGVIIRYKVTFNFHSFAKFLTLRYSSHAQREIYWVAREMLIQLYHTDRFTTALSSWGFITADFKDAHGQPMYVYKRIDFMFGQNRRYEWS